MSSAIVNWASWITSLWNMCAGNIILSVPLLMVAISIILIMFDKIKGLIK